MFPIGLQFYSVRDYAEKDFYGTLKAIKEMGYDGVEFAGLYGYDPKDIRDYLEKIGLKAVSAHVAIDEMLADPEKVFSDYKEIGCDYIAVPYLVPERRPGTDGFDKTLKDMTYLAEIANKHGLVFMYHNHDFEFVKINGEYAFDIMYDTIPASLLQTEQDTCWVNVGGENPAEYIKKYSGRCPVVHIKDFVMKNRDSKSGLYDLIGINTAKAQADEGDFAFRPAGYGVQDFVSVLDAAKAAGSKWIIVEQDKPCLGWTSLECVEKSVNYLKTINK